MIQIMVEYNKVDDGHGYSRDFDMTFQVTRWRPENVYPTFYLKA